MSLVFDRFLRYDELVATLHEVAEQHPHLVRVEDYGMSYEGRALLLVTITDDATGPHHTKPAHWIDANIHAVEVTGGVAALHLVHHLVTASERDDEAALAALRTRTFYIAPRVNPDGVEAALSDAPQYRRSSMRPWPFADRHQWPGLVEHDIDGNGRVLSMRVADDNGAWIEHPEDPRVMMPVPIDGIVPAGAKRYRVLTEGTIVDYDGFTVPRPAPPEALDMNRNFPAGWSTGTRGSGDHPLSEPEIDALVRAIVARPNICGYNAYHTSGGVLLRPLSTLPDAKLPPLDLWTWTQLGARGTELTNYPVHSAYEDFTWDKNDPMSGAADDWAYEHLGVYGWTTEFWDPVLAATGHRSGLDSWAVGPTVDEELAVARWSDQFTEHYSRWEPFDHPQLGPVEIGGADVFHVWFNPPRALLLDEVRQHAAFAVEQALAAPCLEVLQADANPLGDGTWQVTAGIANTGWLPTNISARASTNDLVLPITAELSLPHGTEIVGSANRRQLGQLSGRSRLRFGGGVRNDGTPDRLLVQWIVRAVDLDGLVVVARHPRAGTASRVVSIWSRDDDSG